MTCTAPDCNEYIYDVLGGPLFCCAANRAVMPVPIPTRPLSTSSFQGTLPCLSRRHLIISKVLDAWQLLVFELQGVSVGVHMDSMHTCASRCKPCQKCRRTQAYKVSLAHSGAEGQVCSLDLPCDEDCTDPGISKFGVYCTEIWCATAARGQACAAGTEAPGAQAARTG